MAKWLLSEDRDKWNGRCQDCKWFESGDEYEPCILCEGTDETNTECYFNATALIDCNPFPEYDQTEFGGIKDRRGKPRMSLILPRAAYALVAVREYGLKKYPDAENWKKIPKRDWFDALLRHLFKYMIGEKNDPESGLPHLWHALANLSYMIEGDMGNYEHGKKTEM